MGTLTTYTDPAIQSALPFGRRSHWLQMWRAYLETVPAAQVLAGVGTNVGPGPQDAGLVAQHLARAGLKRARIEVGWDSLDYQNEQVTLAGSAQQRIVACAQWGLRPLILLNANAGSPGPRLGFATTLLSPLAPGDRSAQLASTAGIVLGYTGLSFLAPQNTMASHLITAVSGHSATLSQPYSGTATLAAGTSVPLHTLKYRPFAAVGSPDYAQTSAGWQRYARTVAQWVASLLGRTGRSDLGFDMELWNELTFGTAYLWIANYYNPYNPSPYTDTSASWGAGTHAYQITLDTAALFGRYPADFCGVELVQGFSNTIPWPSSSDAPLAIGGISWHPYPPLTSYGPGITPANTPVDARGLADGSGYEPQYTEFFPEHSLCAIQTESHARNVGPFSDASTGQGRYQRPGAPCWGWITEINQQPTAAGVTLVPDALYVKAKSSLRTWLGWLGKGAQGVLPYAFGGGGDLTDQQASQAFLDYAQTHTTYPSDDSAYTSPTFAALRRALAVIAHGADPEAPVGWGTGPGAGTRAIGVQQITDTHDHAQFGGDGTAAHPPLYDRDCLLLAPIQANAHRFVLVYYVMTRDTMQLRDATKTGGQQYDLPDAPFTVTLSGLNARAAQIAVYDPLADRSVPTQIVSAQDGALTLVLQASDRPYLLTIQERTSGAVAASSYLQNARLNWMLGNSYPAAPAAQYVGLFSVAPTNTTAGTELSAGNYARVQVGLSAPAAPTVTPTGTTGATTYAYQIIKKTAAGSTIGATGATGSTVTTITNGNATLTSSNYNAISWSADSAAASYDVLKWSGSAWTLLGNTSSTSMNDTGQATQSYTVPTQNTTCWTTVQSGVTETISNALPLVWPVANVNWGTAVACAIFDAPTGGNMLDFASLTSSQAIGSGSQYSFPASSLVLGEA